MQIAGVTYKDNGYVDGTEENQVSGLRDKIGGAVKKVKGIFGSEDETEKYKSEED